MSPTTQVADVKSKLVTENATRYMHGLLTPREPEMEAMEQYAREVRFPIIGPLAGQYLYQLTRLMAATKIFELGSGYGYSTAWFARGVRENGGGTIHHVVWDRKLSFRARGHLQRMGLDEYVEFHISEAVQALEASDEQFDIILCDINKEQYPGALPAIRKHLRPGGVLVADNAWWFGRVAHDGDESEATVGMRDFTQEMVNDPEWICTFLPLRDGLLVAYRNGTGESG